MDKNKNRKPEEEKKQKQDSSEKVTYEKPVLTEYGSVRKVTQNNLSRNGADFFGGRRN